MLYARGGEHERLTAADLEHGLQHALVRLGPRRRVLAIPPDLTRIHSRAGELTQMLHRYYRSKLRAVLPALGTHAPLTEQQITTMFGEVPHELFRVHDWRNAVTTLGTVEAQRIAELSEGRLSFEWPAQVASLVAEHNWDLIVSVGQVVPHEVAGMANYTKNLFVGTGGREGIDKSHYLGAVYGTERMMGRAETPVRTLLNEAAERFASHLPVVYVLTVIGEHNGSSVVRGLFISDEPDCFYEAAALSARVNVFEVPKPLSKVVAYMNPEEYHSTWLANKAIYRTRMAIADGGELVVIAPGVHRFGEDDGNDRIIRAYGYHGAEWVQQQVERSPELAEALGAAAHLIHGSHEGRFRVRYATGGIPAAEIAAAGYIPEDLDEMLSRYRPEESPGGVNRTADGEEYFFIPHPAAGLWTAQPIS